MVWYWAGPDFLPANPTDHGFLFGKGALDFAGGTVVHINAGIAGLMGCLVLGKRIGYKPEPMPPHSLTDDHIGACLLWVGWFGFNAGSNLEANGVTAVAFINTYVATAAAALAWALLEQICTRSRRCWVLRRARSSASSRSPRRRASPLRSPRSSLAPSPRCVCFFFVTKVKNAARLRRHARRVRRALHRRHRRRARDRRSSPIRHGAGRAGSTIPSLRQSRASSTLARRSSPSCGRSAHAGLVGRRVAGPLLPHRQDHRASSDREAEREGLDINEHGERAYNF